MFKMKNYTVNMARGFWPSFRRLRIDEVDAFKKEVSEKIGWAETTFNSKRNGNRGLEPAEMIVLKTIFNSYGIEF